MTTAQTPQAHIIIEGCALPGALYQMLKEKACSLRKTQFVGVKYLRKLPAISGGLDDPLSWRTIEENNAIRRADMMRGDFLAYTIGESREELLALPGLSMILWITPYNGRI